ncbi:hypothetical protein CKAH01_00170 [Colletotrichum kahawae]|uniref:Uncharacterized protein n=1 Tax=Colletotrichum kahawae TaxID=34407 RepID=A0AAD9YVG8_COLKA|nr:hypothetical protein CKAH01_00170 [Colletotrichum kahawae]
MPDALKVLAGSAPAVFGYLIHLGFLALVGLLQRQAKRVPTWMLGPKGTCRSDIPVSCSPVRYGGQFSRSYSSCRQRVCMLLVAAYVVCFDGGTRTHPERQGLPMATLPSVD